MEPYLVQTLHKETHVEPAIKKRSVSLGLGVYFVDISSKEGLIGSTFLAEVVSQPSNYYDDPLLERSWIHI